MQDMVITNIHRRDARYNHLNVVCPRYNSRNYTVDAERSFTISAIKAWNMLPLGIRPCSSACILYVIRVNAQPFPLRKICIGSDWTLFYLVFHSRTLLDKTS